jgi:hypothetical protein
MDNLESLPLRFRLFHGRVDPLQQMDDWGTDGPVFPANFVHTTYGRHIRLGGPQHGESHLELYVNKDGLVFYDGVWYGDWTVYTPDVEPDLPLSLCDQSKAEIPKQQQEQQHG